MSTELLPCPFCGDDEPYISETDDGLARWVCCPTCDTTGPPIEWRFSGTKDEARKIVVDAWNKRADLTE
jgi:Lar family restriction alleviation protein